VEPFTDAVEELNVWRVSVAYANSNGSPVGGPLMSSNAMSTGRLSEILSIAGVCPWTPVAKMVYSVLFSFLTRFDRA